MFFLKISSLFKKKKVNVTEEKENIAYKQMNKFTANDDVIENKLFDSNYSFKSSSMQAKSK